MKGVAVILLMVMGMSLAGKADDHVEWVKAMKHKMGEPGVICDVCQKSVSVLQDFFMYDYTLHNDGINLVTDICEIAMPRAVCYNLVSTYAGVLIPAIGTKYLDPQLVCSKVLLCPTPSFVKLNVTEIVADIMSDAPPVLPLPQPGNETYKFIHVSDIHVDLDYEAGSSMTCSYPLCCRTEFGTTNRTSEQAGYWGSPSKCDVPLRTVEAFMKQAASMGVDFVLWTGDNPSHAIWQYVRETHLQNTEVLTGVFKKYFPKTQIYPIMGNHAGFPQDQYHYGNEEWLVQGLTSMWAQWLTPEAQATHLDNACYSMKDNTTGVRVLAINTQMCDNMNLWLILNDTDPAGHLQWMREELYKAEANGEYVLIVGHIPVGDHFCSSTWATIYRALVNRFRNIIRGQFFAHTHKDQFELVKSLTPDQPPAGVAYIVPGLTSFSYHAPSFRVFEMDKTTLQIVNYYNYRLDLEKANNDVVIDPVYDFAYDAISEYGMPDLTPASWAALADEMSHSAALLQQYWVHYNNPIPTTPTCDEKCQKQLVCMMQTSVYDESVKCAGKSTSDIVFQMLEALAGPWEVMTQEAVSTVAFS